MQQRFVEHVVGAPNDLLDALSSPSRLGQRPGLETIRGMLSELGDPQLGLTIVHVGGTSGKGSTATMIARILEVAGKRVGLHVKPHLESVEERFVVDGKPISSETLAMLVREIEPIARRWHPSWYELTVAVAFTYFMRQQVDAAVVEVGLGGTYDATNVVEPAVAVLTNVGLDHVEVLGDTVEAIARDKVGIIKANAITVSGVTQDSVREIVRERSAEVGSPLWLLDQAYSYVIRDIRSTGSRFDLRLPKGTLADIALAPVGAHQVANAATAVAACEALTTRDFRVSSDAIRGALASVAIPGRFEVLRHDPLLVLDGAHNPAKMAALVTALDTVYPGREVIGVLAFKRGHDLAATLQAIAPHLRSAVLTSFDASTDYGRGQAVSPTEIDEVIRGLEISLPRSIVSDPHQAVEVAMAHARADQIICVTGSLYLVGVVRASLGPIA